MNTHKLIQLMLWTVKATGIHAVKESQVDVIKAYIDQWATSYKEMALLGCKELTLSSDYKTVRVGGHE